MDKKVYIIILNYNNHIDTIECLASVNEIDYPNFDIVVVDNNSTDDSVANLKRFEEVPFTLLRSKQNLGYAGGNNLGVQYAIDKGADYLCILNNDTVVERNFLAKLVQVAEANPSFGMIGPAILEYDDREIVQSTGANIIMSRGNVPPNNVGKNIHEVDDQIIECDYIGGACILVNREVIDRVGLIPENYFLFYEETEWCYQAKKMGYGIICYTESKIYHKESHSINKIQGLSKYLMMRNRVVFVKRNGTFLEKCQFSIYLFLKCFQLLLTGRGNWEEVKFYLHGVFNKVDLKRYPFILIPE